MRLKLASIPLRTALVYWLAGILWILLSDRLLVSLVSDADGLSRLQTIKGWAFVTVTAAVLYAALHAQLRIANRESERRRQAEEGLRLKGAALEAAANAVVITDREGRIQWVNPAFTAVSGYSLEETLGRNPRELTKSGHHDHAFYRQLWETITAGRVWRGEVTNRRKDGKLIVEDLTITPVRDDEGAISHFIGIKQELTETKRLEAQLMRAHRLESVGRLAGGIAHDLNNVLTPILAGAQMLQDDVPTASGRELLDHIRSSARRGADIIRQILTFSRGIEGPRAPVQLSLLVTEIQGIMRRTFPKNIHVRTEVADNVAPVTGDVTQLHQVLMNLCINARDAMPAGGTLTIALSPVDIDEAWARTVPEAKPGPHVLLCIHDTGTGIAAEHLEHIFDPFFTTKEPGKGTGLGLPTVRGIVRSHQGFLQVESARGTGTQFRIYLPAISETATADAAPAAREPGRGEGELVLIVDDESSIRCMLRQLLENHGYRVAEAVDGTVALSAYLERQNEISVVVTDAHMPSMAGLDLIKAIRGTSATVPVIVTTGSGDLQHAAQFRDVGVSDILTKPFPPDDLLRALEQCLAGPSRQPREMAGVPRG